METKETFGAHMAALLCAEDEVPVGECLQCLQGIPVDAEGYHTITGDFDKPSGPISDFSVKAACRMLIHEIIYDPNDFVYLSCILNAAGIKWIYCMGDRSIMISKGVRQIKLMPGEKTHILVPSGYAMRILRKKMKITQKSSEGVQLQWRRGTSSINADLPENSVLNVHRGFDDGVWDYKIMICGSVVGLGSAGSEQAAMVKAEQVLAKVINSMPKIEVR